MGFIKFDILGLASLRMLEGAIERILQRHYNIETPSFEQIRDYYNKHLHPEVIDLTTKMSGKMFFILESGLEYFSLLSPAPRHSVRMLRPNNIIDLAAITSIYRPGPLSANVDKKFIGAKENQEEVEYVHEIVKEVTEETYGFLIFQEQLPCWPTN